MASEDQARDTERGGDGGRRPTAATVAAEEAYDAFFRTSWARLQGQAYVLTGNLEQAQDLTQEALLRAWTHWDRITGYESAEGWTRRVLHNLCIGSWRRTQVRPLSVVREPVPTVDVPTDHVLLAEALRQLPGAQARALLLHDGLGMTVAETAGEIGVPEGTVKSWLSRSRKIVAAHLERSQRPTPGGGET
jgi:RNA polymerase sigma-70 factor (ECF subfamily)